MTNAEKFYEVFGGKVDMESSACIQSLFSQFDCAPVKCSSCQYEVWRWAKKEYKEPKLIITRHIEERGTLEEILKFIQEKKIPDEEITALICNETALPDFKWCLQYKTHELKVED